MTVDWDDDFPVDYVVAMPTDDPTASSDGPRRRARRGVAVAAVAVAIAAYALGRASVRHPTATRLRSISVAVAVREFGRDPFADEPGICSSDAPFDDINGGLPVLIRNAGTGAVVGDSLPIGRVKDSDCVFDFAVSVPEDWNLFVVQVGHHTSSPLTLAQLTTTRVRFT